VRTDCRGVLAALAVGAIAVLTLWLGSSAVWLWLVEPVDVDESVDSVSAAAIARRHYQSGGRL
jgi:hypothetical protein